MKLYISFGNLNLKYFIYSALFSIVGIFIIFYNDYYDKENNILNKNNVLDLFCYYIGYLLNFIPEWINQKNSKTEKKPKISDLKERETKPIEYIYNDPNNEYLSTKDIIKFVFICLILLLADLIGVIIFKINQNNKKEDEEEKEKEINFISIELLFIFLLSKCFKEGYYKHQNISIILDIIIGIIKTIFFTIRDKAYQIPNFAIIVILCVIYNFLYSVYYIYIKGLMKYKFISPYKSNFMIGVINVPLIIIIYIIISFTAFGKNENKNNIYYIDSIYDLFDNIKSLDAINAILLTLLPFAYGIYALLINKIIYDFTLYHIYIPLLIERFINETINQENISDIVFLILCFIIELIIILIFLEIIEVNFCGLNENLKRNIESRGIIDSSLINKYDDEYDDNESYTNKNETKK